MPQEEPLAEPTAGTPASAAAPASEPFKGEGSEPDAPPPTVTSEYTDAAAPAPDDPPIGPPTTTAGEASSPSLPTSSPVAGAASAPIAPIGEPTSDAPALPPFLRDRTAQRTRNQAAGAAADRAAPPAPNPNADMVQVRFVGESDPIALPTSTNAPRRRRTPSPAAPTEADGARSEPVEVKIYTLWDPRAQLCYYVGSSRKVSRRITQHLTGAFNGEPGPKAAWLRTLIQAGLRPEVQIVATTTPGNAYAAEQFWIATLRAAGHPLTNVPAPGEPPVVAPFQVSRAEQAVGARQPAVKRGGQRNWAKGGLVAVVLFSAILGTALLVTPRLVSPPSWSNWTRMLPLTRTPDSALGQPSPAGLPPTTAVAADVPTPTANTPMRVIVQVGDTIVALAARYHISALDLAAMNGYPATIYAGQELLIPPAGYVAPPPPSGAVRGAAPASKATAQPPPAYRPPPVVVPHKSGSANQPTAVRAPSGDLPTTTSLPVATAVAQAPAKPPAQESPVPQTRPFNPQTDCSDSALWTLFGGYTNVLCNGHPPPTPSQR